jgi:predicted metalloprotease
MRWGKGRRSSNIEDRRGGRGRAMKAGGGIGLGTIALVIIAMLFGVDPSMLLQGGDSLQSTPSGYTQQSAPQRPRADDQVKEFVSVVLGDTEDTWNRIFRDQLGKTYAEPTLVLFEGSTTSACGLGKSAMGPFYCPGDQKVYLDMSFFQELKNKFGAPGDFAQAYVIAHEVGHHVQTILGISKQVRAAQKKASKVEGNHIQVMMELQADCFSGVWANKAHKARNILERGDLQEALGAATAIGDDTLQYQAQGHITPDAFTHGTSEQRVRWFRTGLESGDIQQCDTFSARNL